MIRKILTGIIGLVAAITLTACGSIQGAAQSFLVPCKALHFDEVDWSPDGRHIAYQVHNEANPPENYVPQIVVMNPDGSGVVPLKTKPILNLGMQWLPDSRTLAYATWMHHVLTTSLDGATTEAALPIQLNTRATFSPDGRRIAYNGIRLEGDPAESIYDIYVANIDGSQVTKVADGHDLVYEWSPDGSRIAYVATEGSTDFVMTIRSDASDRVRVIEGSGPVRWSPDGGWLSYFSLMDSALHVVRPDGSSEKLVAKDVWPSSFTWLQDSGHISYAATFGGLLNVVNISTSKVESISSVMAKNDQIASWSPDGKQVAFIGYDASNPSFLIDDIYVVNRDGTGQVRITDNPHRYQCFNWPF
jgi:Tol biopolymer transport system component